MTIAKYVYIKQNIVFQTNFTITVMLKKHFYSYEKLPVHMTFDKIINFDAAL